MIRATAGQVLVNDLLPEDLRDYGMVLDKKGVEALLQKVADAHPDKYREVSHRLLGLGREWSYRAGGYSFGLDAVSPSRAWEQAKAKLQADIDAALDGPGTDQERQDKVVELVKAAQKGLAEKIMAESLADDNPLALQVLSGSRGNPGGLKSLRGADGLYQDHRDRPIPVPILNSYAAGLSPAEFFAGSFGARKGVLDTKLATQDGGFFAKQLVQLAHRLVVGRADADGEDDDPEYAARHARRGLPVDTDDPDNEGALLSYPAGGYPRDTVLTARVLKDLRAKGVGRVVVRSPLVGAAPDGTLYAKDVGVRESGGLPGRGSMVGITGAQAIAEPVSQGALSSKHSGGVVGAAKSVSGFKHLNQLIQVPKSFPGAAAHAQVDGRVGAVEPAPQGGHYVTVGGERHYVYPGFQVRVKPGDEVEAGDVLSDGIPNPAKVVEHKGVGAGRAYFVKAFREAMKDAGLSGARRNIELVGRGLINHVELTDEVGDRVPGDVVPYDLLERDWTPRPGARPLPPAQAAGKYLERPVLHYTVGTRLRPSVLKDLAEFGVTEVEAHDDPPPFVPRMVRGLENLQHDPDPMTRMLGSNLEKGTLKAVHRGDVSDPLGTSYVPALALAPTTFGRTGVVVGAQPPTPVAGKAAP